MNLPFRVVNIETGEVFCAPDVKPGDPFYGRIFIRPNVEIHMGPGGQLVKIHWIGTAKRKFRIISSCNAELALLVAQHQAGNFTDKHGTQLWEGDTVDCFAYGKRVIKWSDKRAMFVLARTNAEQCQILAWTGQPNPRLRLEEMNPTGMERIGNELLKEGKTDE